ncbi:hypothetical protein LR48_Vigan02g214500 [Vigna angularis]|uniref:Uncharacterized protein n=1 Tax=Phaseolus angularis TaxID=3914 RepID=A0A0L9TZN8_PHAAN|nr:hypothetical protein LR48_Vigan02g214500 [Vigna angularis]
MAEAFELKLSMRSIKHLQTYCLLSAVLAILFTPDIASQQGDPGMGSGVPWVMNKEHAEKS